MEELQFIKDVLRFFGEQNDSHHELWWRVYDNKVRFLINCNDLFMWAFADSEELTPENFPVLKQSVEDCRALLAKDDALYDGFRYGLELFCARIRKQRPQGPAYPSYKARSLYPLFDACGPEREVGMGNPCKPGEYKGQKAPEDLVTENNKTEESK